MTTEDKRNAPTIPPDSCPADRRLTQLCRQIVRDRRDREAQQELAKKQIAMWIEEGCWS